MYPLGFQAFKYGLERAPFFEASDGRCTTFDENELWLCDLCRSSLLSLVHYVYPLPFSELFVTLRIHPSIAADSEELRAAPTA
jgi:hypothetical protein